MELIEKTISEVKTKHAPDKRVALFNVEVNIEADKIVLKGETTEPEAKTELLNILKKNNLTVTDSIELLPAANVADKHIALVNNSVANIRSNPRHSAELATQALLGTPLKVFKEEEGFYLVQTPDKYISWVDADGIFRITKDEYDAWVNSNKIIYTKEYGFSYTKPDDDAERVSDLVIGDILLKIGEDDDYVKVRYPDGREAYVEKDESEDFNTWLANAYPTKNNIIETAKLFMGNPYLWGGTSAKGLDCSGFSKTVYFLNGVLLDRDASQQVKKGIPVDTENGFENLEKGDLLFFGVKSEDGKKERITHVGIYIENLEFIHESGRVKYNSFDKSAPNFSSFRLKGFSKARRIISSVGKNGIELIKNNKFYNGGLK